MHCFRGGTEVSRDRTARSSYRLTNARCGFLDIRRRFRVAAGSTRTRSSCWQACPARDVYANTDPTSKWIGRGAQYEMSGLAFGLGSSPGGNSDEQTAAIPCRVPPIVNGRLGSKVQFRGMSVSRCLPGTRSASRALTLVGRTEPRGLRRCAAELLIYDGY